mgnify:FL=1
MENLTFETISVALTALVALASVIVALTPTDADDNALDRVKNILRKLNLLKPKK